MTCIAAIAEGGVVYMGGDSAGVGGLSLTVRADEKVFRTGPYVMGFTTSFRMGQVLRFSQEWPVPPRSNLLRFMATEFVDSCRSHFKTAGWMGKHNDREQGGTFLVGVRGQLFAIHEDFQVAWPADRYSAVGSGGEVALGALAVSRGRPPRERIRAALAAAEHHNAGVRRPFRVVAGR